MRIFSGTTNEAFTSKICRSLGVEQGKVYHHTFPSGETYVQFKTNVRGDDVFLVQGMGNGGANDNLMQLLIMADAARRSSAKRITAVMPMTFYTRQDRKDKSRTPISAKLVMDLLQAAGVNRILTMDLHAAQIQGFTNMPVDVLQFKPVLSDYINSKYDRLKLRNEYVVVAPDIGAVKRAEEYSKSLQTGLALIVKIRNGDEDVEIQSFVGDVKDKHCIIIDDLTESVGTLLQAAKACKERGAKTVTCAVTHGCFTQTGITRLQSDLTCERYIDEFIYSDTVECDWNKISEYPITKPDGTTVLSVAPLFANAIKNTNEDKSISELFN